MTLTPSDLAALGHLPRFAVEDFRSAM